MSEGNIKFPKNIWYFCVLECNCLAFCTGNLPAFGVRFCQLCSVTDTTRYNFLTGWLGKISVIVLKPCLCALRNASTTQPPQPVPQVRAAPFTGPPLPSPLRSRTLRMRGPAKSAAGGRHFVLSSGGAERGGSSGPDACVGGSGSVVGGCRAGRGCLQPGEGCGGSAEPCGGGRRGLWPRPGGGARPCVRRGPGLAAASVQPLGALSEGYRLKERGSLKDRGGSGLWGRWVTPGASREACSGRFLSLKA